MKSIEELNPANFGCFYFSPLKGDVSLYLLSPQENIEYTDYEAYSCDAGTIIAFNKFNPQSTDFEYLLVCNGQEEKIQFQLYENLKYIFDGDDYRQNSFYALFGSKSVVLRAENGEHLFIPLDDHCDKYIYGPAPFFELQDGVSETLLDLTIFNAENIQGIFPVLAVQGVACILRIDMKHESGSYRNYPAVTAISKTLIGLLRMACEWREMTKPPFDNIEFPALQIAEFVNRIGIDANIENSIRSTQEPMHVERFITSPETAREAIEESRNFPDEVRQLFMPQLRYRTLNELNRNLDVLTGSGILDKEKLDIQYALYEFMINNNLDFSTFSSEDAIKSYLQTNEFVNVEHHRLSIYDYLEKNVGL